VIRAGYGFSTPSAVGYCIRRRDCRRWPLGAVALYRQHSFRLRGCCPRRPPRLRIGFDSPANLNGSSIFQGALNALPNMSYLPNQQRFDPLAPVHSLQPKLPDRGFPLPILPFTLPLGKDFVYGYANQANLTIEREIAGSWKFSLGYQRSRGCT